MSVQNKENVASTNAPFQIMPATQNMLSDKTILSYPVGHNPSLLLHMNYITRIFSDKAIINDSTARFSLRQYVKLAKRLGTKNILIHLPYTATEWSNIEFGLQLIKDEIIDNDCIAHLEIPAWSKDLFALFDIPIYKNKEKANPVDYISDYFDVVLEYCNEFPPDSYKLVPDTAHMWSNGCTTFEHFKQLLIKYSPYIEYVHLNGNINPPFKMDSHVPIFDDGTYNKITCSKEIVELVAEMNVICVAEVTNYTLEWNQWKDCAKDYDLDIVEYNSMYAV